AVKADAYARARVAPDGCWTARSRKQYPRAVLRFASWSLAILLFATSARAQEPEAAPETGASPENLEATQRAREHFMAGVEHFSAHRYREAIRAFSLAAQLVPSADLWFNIARAHEE